MCPSSRLRITGRYERSSVGGEEVKVFISEMLPPHEPPVVVEGALAERLGRAETANRLCGLCELCGKMFGLSP
jgi:hypothetical protein